MDNPIAETVNKTEGFINKVTSFDAETKNNLLNGIQYVTMATLPIAMSGMLLNHLFGKTQPDTKGSIELLAEIMSQAVVTLVLLFIIHKVIVSIPTYTGVPMSRINYSTLALATIVAMFSFNAFKINDKFSVLVNKLNESWSGKKEEPVQKGKGGKVSVSQPISRGMGQPIPTHQASRADHVQTHQVMQPPLLPSMSNNQNATGNDMYGGPSNSLVGAEFPMNMAPEPEAFNSLGSAGFSGW